MAKRRDLKKTINYIAGELFTECLMHKLYIPGSDPEKADKLLTRILVMQNEFVSRISHTEPGNTKNFYKKLHSDFQSETNAIIEEIGKLN